MSSSTVVRGSLRIALALSLALGLHAQAPRPHPNASLTAPWQPLGPTSITSTTYGNLTGRITALTLDPNDPTNNTLYLGATGGGVWKSTNAAGPLAAITFTPLTDTLPVFAANTGAAVPSLSIGALAVQPQANPVLLAGTGDPNDATDSFYGEGLLRSTDNGLTWTLIQNSHDGVNGNHSFVGLATAGLAFSTKTPALAVAAFTTSAQAALVNATNTSSIPGLYYSTDAGVTWQMATVEDGATIVQQPQPLGTGQVGNAATAVVWNSFRSEFIAAVRFHGYYASTDGATWTRLPTQPGFSLTTANCPVGANGLGASTCPIFRGALAVQPFTGDLYALTVDANNLDQGLWQDLCNPSSFTCASPAPLFNNRIDNAALEVGNGSTAITQGDYNLTLSAAPSGIGGTTLFAGTLDLYRCTLALGSSSCALRNTTNALNGCVAPALVAPAQHALATIQQATTLPLIFLGNDGGLWRSTDGVAETGSPCAATDKNHFDNLNAAIATGGSLAETTGFAQHPTNADTLLIGLGANGSAATTTATLLTPWMQLSVGEGGYPHIDANTPTNWFAAIGAGVNLKSCTNGASCTPTDFLQPATIGATQVLSDASLIDAPTLLDPALTTNVLVGTCRVWRGAANFGSTWNSANAISPSLNGSATPCTAASPLIRSLAAGGPTVTSINTQNSGSTVLYAGIAGSLSGGANIPGHIFATTSANLATSTVQWTDVALSPVTNDPAGFNPGHFDVSALAADAHDATGGTIYAAIDGFSEPHLYRSTDFGKHWSNVSANLPNAPANAILIDPNDANTLYIALDAGIYVTTAISTCPTANCWSPLGTGLPNSPIVALDAAPQLLTGDGRRGMLRAATYGRGIWQTPLITATSLAQPALALSATSFTFPDTQVATQSAPQTLTITSNGNAPLTITSFALTGDFTVPSATDNCSGQTLAVNAQCTLQIIFAPTQTGTRTGQLTIYANISGGQATVALSGNGINPAAIVLNPLSLTFAATIVNQTTAAQIITVSNTGGTTATLQTPIISGDFAISANTCGTTLAASTGCSLSITFTPTATGTRTGTLTLTDSAGTQVAQLTGIGQAPATDTLSPPSLTFAQQQIGTTSPSQQVTLTNSGDIALTLVSTSVSPGDFTAVSSCGTSLAAHSTCAITVTFIPTTTGTRSATLTVSDQFRSQTVSLTGTGVAPAGVSLSPSSLTFAATGVGLNSIAQALTLTNNGGLPLAISNIAISANFTIATNTCTTTLAASSSCTLQIVFAPTSAGALSGTVTLTDNAASGTQTASLSGIGIDFTLTATSATSATIASGSSAVYTLQLASLAGLSGSVATACTGAPAHSTCTISPSTPSLGNTTTLIVTVSTGLANVKLNPAPPLRGTRAIAPILWALALPLFLFARGRRISRLVLPLAFLALLLTISGCGAGRTIPNSPINPITTPTPAGTYNLNVTASAAGLNRNVSLTLIVQ
ncbi:MAG: choice-of-anchor D domain-containing protein [Acidobacteriota bacterium]